MTLFTQSQEHTLYQVNVDCWVKWFDKILLIINNVKTEEIIFGKPSNLQFSPVKIHNSEINLVPTYKLLGVMIDGYLSWTSHIEFSCKKTQQRICFLRRLSLLGAISQIISLFFTSVIQSAMLYCTIAWQLSKSKLRQNYIIKLKFVQRSLDYL